MTTQDLNGVLRRYAFVVIENNSIGCQFNNNRIEEIDEIENAHECNKIYTSDKLSVEGHLPIQMSYSPCVGVEWKTFVKILETNFNTAFNY